MKLAEFNNVNINALASIKRLHLQQDYGPSDPRGTEMDYLVPRRELDAKMLAIETEQRKADIRLREIDLEILKLKERIK